jgi:hypothetical protein
VALTYSKFAVLLDQLIYRDSIIDRLKRKELPSYSNANWFNFATWGTVTLSRNIAHQRPPQRVDDLLPLPLRRRLTPAILRERAASGQRVSRALAWGQRQIFLTATFALLDFRRSVESRTALDLRSTRDAVARFASERDPTPIGPQRHLTPLKQAFDWYEKARRAPDEDERARWILGANVLLTAMEQDLAQRAVNTVIDHVPHRALTRIDRRVARSAEAWTGVPRQLVELQLPFQQRELRDMIQTAWARLMTDQVLVLALPTETLRVGRDIPSLDPGRPYYPRSLRRLETWPDDLIGVGQLVRSFDRTRGNGVGSAAQDWRRFDDRMNWAVTLMRSRQQDLTLFWPPYSREDERRILDGCLPNRAGDPSELEVQAPLDDHPQHDVELYLGRRL